MDIERIRELYLAGCVNVTRHINKRIAERFVTFHEIREVILNGDIIEEYPDDKYYPSCLVLGFTVADRPLHIVVGIAPDEIWLVTVYEPSTQEWEDGFKIRRPI